jgi:hypothetical protein
MSTVRKTPSLGACAGRTGAVHVLPMTSGDQPLWLEQRDGMWMLAGSAAGGFGLANEYLSYLADRNYSPRTARSYGFSLLAFCR